MADKSIKVTIDIEMSKAKSALQNLANETKKATAELDKTSKVVTQSGLSFKQQAAAVFTGIGAYDLASKALRNLTGFVTSSIAEAHKAEEAQAQLNAVLQSTGYAAGVTAKEMIDLASSLQKQSTFSDDAILSAENLLLTFTKIGKDIMPDATKIVLDMSTALGQDLKSSAIQVGKALQDPILGVTALRRVGVNFNEQQIEQIRLMVEAGQTAKAQAFIMKELNTEFGGSAQAELATYSGQVKRLKNQWDDFKEMVGNYMLPIIGEFVEGLNNLTGATNELGNETARAFGVRTVQYMTQFGTLLTSIFSIDASKEGPIDFLKRVRKEIDAIGNQADESINKILDPATKKLDENLKKQADVFAGASAASDEAKKDMEALTEGYKDLIDKSNRFSFETEADFTKFAGTLTNTKGKHADFIKSVTQGMDAFRGKIDGINKEIEGLQDKLKSAADAFNSFVADTNRQGSKDFAQIVHDAEKRIPEIQSRLSTPNLSASEQESLYKELVEKQKIVDTFRTGDLQKNADFMSQLKFLREQDNRNELEQAMALVQQKIDERTKEFENEKQKIQAEIDEREKAKSAYIIAQDAMSKALAENVDARKKSYDKEIASAYALRDALNAAANAQARLSGVSGTNTGTTTVKAFASGGVVTRPTLALVGEAGPEKIEPLGRGSSFSGMTININNPTVRSDEDIREIVRQVNEALSRRDELAQFGAYK